jgi:rhamnulokinase
MHTHLAVDLGAESGRVVLGRFDGDRIALEELRRFPTGTTAALGHKHWNLLRLYEEMLQACRLAASASPAGPIQSIGVDSWGVDFVLIGQDGQPVGLPVAYRDSRTDGMMEKLFKIVPAEKVYAATGIQFMQFNTLFQLFSMVVSKSPQLAIADGLLMVPDYFHYLFTGRRSTEFTNASTTQCVDIASGQWDENLLREVGIPTHIFQPIMPPGSKVGLLTAEMQHLTGLGEISVIAPASHDTASAVAAVPAEGDDWAYISSGTWSLVGVETRQPIATPQARAFNFTNEGGVAGTTRLLKNVAGLWLVQQLRAGLDKTYDYPTLTELAKSARPFASLVDPDDVRFLAPESMPAVIADFCRQTGQAVPQAPGEFVRCALESLAMQYKLVLEQVRQLIGRGIGRIHIVGGGSKNSLLCQLTADATGLPVLAGPAEGTALGNLIVQAISAGHIGSLAQGRAMIRNSVELIEYNPQPAGLCDEAWRRFLQLKSR